MVDGIKVGESISSDKKERFGIDGCSNDSYVDDQDFRDADMVVVMRKPLSVMGQVLQKCESGNRPDAIAKHTIYECYGIYGNVLVTATVNKDNIKEINKKYVWSYRKPYILNGDDKTGIKKRKNSCR